MEWKEKETPELIGLTVNKTDMLKKEAKKSKEAKKNKMISLLLLKKIIQI